MGNAMPQDNPPRNDNCDDKCEDKSDDKKETIMIPPLIIPPLVDLVLNKIISPGKEREAARKFAADLLADPSQVKDLQHALDQTLRQIDEGQIAINRVEAASDHLWKSGWRPAAGWICIIALGWHYLFEPLLATLLIILGVAMPELPRVDFNDLWTLLFALLGLSGLRSIDKRR
jgi:hypothetical protein